MDNLRHFLWSRYSAFPLMLSSENALPGMLLEARWFFSRPRRLLREDGFVWDLLKLNKSKYSSRVARANIIQESIDDEMTFGGAVRLPQLGLSLSASLGGSSAAVMKVTGIRARVFRDTSSAYELMQKCLEQRARNARMWEWVNDDFLIVESYYVTSFVAEFKRARSRDLKVEFEKAGLKAEGSVKFNWRGESRLEMVGTPAVPIAVRGLRV